MLKRALLLLMALACPAAASAQDARPPMRGDSIGVNTAIQPYYYQDSYAFTNAYKGASDWIINWSPNPDAKIAVDKNGGLLLPEGNTARVMMFYESPSYPLGKYVVTFEGDGDFRFGDKDFIRPPGRFECDATKREGWGFYFSCIRSNPKNPVRITAVWMPGYEGSRDTFTEEFVRDLRGYAALRTVNDQNAIGGNQSTWAGRAMLKDPRWNKEDGVPIEALCELANRTGADLWLNVPLKYDDDAVIKMARLVKRELVKERKVYVEYYCEAWNWGFPGATYMKTRFAPEGKTDPADNNFYGFTDYHPWRSRQIFSAWESEWTGKDRDRLVTVISGQHSWPDLGRKWLAWAKKFNGGGKPCDAYAVGPYFYPSGDSGATLDALFASLRAGLEDIRKFGRENRKIADEFGVKLVAYEAGQHLVGGDRDIPANRDPRMADLYREYLDILFDGGFELVNMYSQLGRPGQWGSWGMRENGRQPIAEAPKLRAVRGYMIDGTRRITPDVLKVPAADPAKAN